MARTKKIAKLKYAGKQPQKAKPVKSLGKEGISLTRKECEDKQRVRFASKATRQLVLQARQAAWQAAQARKNAGNRNKPHCYRPGILAL